MTYFVLIREEALFRFDLYRFEEELKLRWAEIKAEFITFPESIYSLTWRLRNDRQTMLSGNLHKNGERIVFDGTLHYVVEFAAWLRSIVPSSVKMIFFDEGYTFELSLTPGIAGQQILDLLA
jgi:hypothetical protein